MKKRIFTSLATIALASTLVGGATFAVFTSQATNTDNTFKAGTLKVLAGDQTYGLSITNLKPGDVRIGSFVITNDGTLPLDYTITPAATGHLFTAGDWNYDGVVDNNPATVTLTSSSTGTLEVGATETINYEINFPTDAGNDFQGQGGALAFTVDASQQ